MKTVSPFANRKKLGITLWLCGRHNGHLLDVRSDAVGRHCLNAYIPVSRAGCAEQQSDMHELFDGKQFSARNSILLLK
jgi:hypothetical protein